MNKSKRAKIVISFIAVLFAISMVVLMFFSSPTAPIAFGKDYPFEETYKLYQGYADTYIETWDKNFIDDDSVIAIYTDIDENSITVQVDGIVSNVEAKYPIEFATQSDEKGNVIISFNNGNYKNYSDVESKFFYSAVLVVEFFVSFILFYMINNGIHSIANSIIARIKKKKYK